jgi:Trk K+ transport system NAD-binding subunit
MELPTQCLIVVVGGEGSTHFPDREETVTAGQHLTLIGDRGAVHEGVQLLSGEVTIASV